jgi:hypothetical protein
MNLPWYPRKIVHFLLVLSPSSPKISMHKTSVSKSNGHATKFCEKWLSFKIVQSLSLSLKELLPVLVVFIVGVCGHKMFVRCTMFLRLF